MTNENLELADRITVEVGRARRVWARIEAIRARGTMVLPSFEQGYWAIEALESVAGLLRSAPVPFEPVLLAGVGALVATLRLGLDGAETDLRRLAPLNVN